MKKYFLLVILFLILDSQVYSQTHYLTVRVSVTFKNKVIKHHMNAEIGSEMDHPLKGKIVHVEGTGSIKILESANEFVLLNSETDMLTYFENNGWDLVSANNIMIIEDKLIQYLFKSE